MLAEVGSLDYADLKARFTKVAKELEATKNAETIDAIEVKDEDASRDTEESTEG